MIDVIIQNAKNSIPLRFKVGRAALVIGNVAILGMGRSVNLNDESRIAAEKVNGEWANWVLANEFVIL
jgi:hypothetical protein